MTEKKIVANFKNRADAERALERLEALGARDLEICEAVEFRDGVVEEVMTVTGAGEVGPPA
ncbi:MAG: hypothetical protein QME13_08535 [Thermoanaerobacteraceae bacterium]|nr:hypothetical protein [Thermoanaerobacteraceae bacterium]